MTGAEIAAVKAGKVVIDVGKKVVENDTSISQELQRLASDSSTMLAAAETRAKRIAVKEEFLLRLYKPLAMLVGVQKAYFDNEFNSDMANKIADIPEDRLTTPKPSVAVPAMQGLACSLDEPDLKELYLSLLATATDSERTDAAHPSFAEIIKQLSAEEAALLRVCFTTTQMGIIRVKSALDLPSSGFVPLQHHILNWTEGVGGEPKEVPYAAVYMDNWARLGLVTLDYSNHLLAENSYDWAEARPEYIRWCQEHVVEGRTVKWDKGIFRVTDFGQRFGEAVGIMTLPQPLPPA
jgi:hypothetical protein